MSHFTVQLNDADTRARTGILRTAHGEVKTPVFMPVGTRAAVRGVTPDQLEKTGASMILSNALHLSLRPGADLIRDSGGLHRFMQWKGPILTDSGGFQVFSLARWRKMGEDGVTFHSPVDGATCFVGPRESMAMQEAIGADVAMCFDECPSLPSESNALREAVDRTLRWAVDCREAHTRKDQLLFGIVQGGLDVDLRAECLEGLERIGFDGYALGGLSVGETHEDMTSLLREFVHTMPKDRPRYLMGVGTPGNILEAVACGVDMFDCVMPTRNARNGTVFTKNGKLRILKNENRTASGPIDPECTCATCFNFSLAYLRHLFNVNELLGMTLATIHNISYYCDLMAQTRTAIAAGRFREWSEKTRAQWC